MDLNFEKIDDILIISLYGELDHHSSEEIRAMLDDRIERDDIKNLILNFEHVTFMDSSGIGVVIGRYKKMQQKKGTLCIAKARNNINKVFEISGLYKLIKSYDTVDEAVRCI